MEQEKEIEKTFQTLIKQQQKNTSRPTSSTSKPVTNNRPIPSSQLPPSIHTYPSLAALP